MKTTIEISDDLLIEAKQVAASLRVSLRSLVEKGLEDHLKSTRATGADRAGDEPAVYGESTRIVSVSQLPGSMGLGPSDKVKLESKKGRYVLTPITGDYVKARRGMLEGSRGMKALKRSRGEEAER